MLTTVFLQLIARYNPDSNLANNLWLEIFTLYSEPKRHYHNISHIENMLADLVVVSSEIEDWDSILFALFYHDAIYKPGNSSNEKKSAQLAIKSLKKITCPDQKISLVSKIILNTERHEINSEVDINYFTDVDLAILGKDKDIYQNYTEQIRAENNSYPDFIYNSGRKKILKRYLKMDRIFKTEYFYSKYEAQSRINIIAELSAFER